MLKAVEIKPEEKTQTQTKTQSENESVIQYICDLYNDRS